MDNIAVLSTYLNETEAERNSKKMISYRLRWLGCSLHMNLTRFSRRAKLSDSKAEMKEMHRLWLNDSRGQG